MNTVLRRRLTITSPDGLWIVILMALVTGVLFRLVGLDVYVLGDREAEWAYDAWSLFHGRPLPAGEQIPDISPTFLLIQSVMFFIFGATDAIARSGAALLGAGLLFLILALRPFLSRQAIAGMLIVGAISPVLVYSSRTNDPAIAIAFFSLLMVVSILRAGIAESMGNRVGWIGLSGFSFAATLGSGPEGVTALIAVGFGLLVASLAESRSPGAVRTGVRTIFRSVSGILLFAGSAVGGLIVLFSRLFSDLTAMTGILDTFAEWGQQMANSATPLPPSFFFYALLLYELLAIAFAVYAVFSGHLASDVAHHDRRLSPSLFSVWFVIALGIHSFASGRETEQTVLIALPLLLLGGIGLGRLIGRINWSGFWTTRTGLLPLALLGLLIGVLAIFVAFARANDPQASGSGDSLLFQVVFVVLVVIIPLGYLVWSRMGADGAIDLGRAALLVVAVVLVLFGFRSTTQLAYVRADDGNELIARSVPTEGTRSLVSQIDRLSRDLSVENLSNIDNTGSYGVRIAVSPEVEWPFVWYFRDYPNVRVVGPAGWTEEDDIVIAPTPEAMDSAGFVVNQRSFETRTANAHVDLNAGTMLGNVVSPEEWYPSIRYLLFREMESGQSPSTVAVGYAFRISNQINPSLGPFDIFTRNTPGPGSGLGQLSSPTDIAVSQDGETIYVINAGNQRIERYARDGTFIGIWDATTDPGLAMAFENGQGPSGITIGPDGLIYIADTWNHIVIVLDDEGHVVRQLGQRGVQTDIGDGSDPASEPGLFFGPRGVAILNDEIYVTDTGNERVQVFGKDGTFLRAFGGYGSGTGELLEPTGVVAGPDGNVWVADSGNGRIVVFSPQGDVVQEIPVESWSDQVGVDRINDLAFSEDGVLYLSAPSRGLLEAWNGETFVDVGMDEIVRPVGITVAPDGALLAVDGAESLVVQIQPELPEGFPPGAATPQASPGASPMATPEF